MKKITFLWIVFFIGCTVMGQNAAEDIKRINRFYLSESYSCKIEMKVYDQWQGGKMLEEKSGLTQKWQGYKSYELGDMHTISTPESYLAVDHAGKSIFLSRQQVSSNDGEALLSNMESMLKLCHKIDFKDEGKGLASYTLYVTTTGFDRVKIVYDKKKFFVQQMIIFSKINDGKEVNSGKLNNPRIEIRFDEVITNNKFTKSDFSFSKYLGFNKGSWVKRAEYASYQLIDQLSIKQ